MKHKTTYPLIVILLFTFLFTACGGGATLETSEEPIAIAPSYEESEAGPIAVEESGQTVAVTRVVTEQIVEEVIVEPEYEYEEEPAEEAPAEEDYADAEEAAESEPLPPAPAPLATAPDDNSIASAPLATPVPTQVAVQPANTFFEDYGVNPYTLTTVDNLSTFSLDVDTGSYTIARNYLMDGIQPPPDAIRVEEFVNAFDQGYAIPPNTAFAVYADGAPSPFHNDGTHFLRIGVQGQEIPESVRPSAALTFVIDVSGSMNQENRLGLVKRSLQLLVDQMRADDSIAIVVYGSTARVVLPPTSGAYKDAILSTIYSLEPEGSTNMEAGLLLGYDEANRAYIPNGINRVILASDGVANVGDTGPNSLAAKIRGYADSGIQLTTVGFGMGNYNDVMMEQLADQGDGHYAYIDTLQEAEELFVTNLMSTLQTIALDAKIQVDFDPNVVQQYRLIGYENRAIADQDFRNDDIDAAEFGAGHTAAAIYAVQFVPGAQGRVATVNLRWQDPQSRTVQEISGAFTTNDLARTFDDAPVNHQVSVVVSQFAELLRNSYWTDGVSMNDLSIRADRLAAQTGSPEVLELANLISLSR